MTGGRAPAMVNIMLTPIIYGIKMRSPHTKKEDGWIENHTPVIGAAEVSNDPAVSHILYSLRAIQLQQ